MYPFNKINPFRKRKVPEGEQTTPERPKRGPGRPPKDQTPAAPAEAAPQNTEANEVRLLLTIFDQLWIVFRVQVQFMLL